MNSNVIVVTGGTGFIGSHVVVKILEHNIGTPVILDNLSNSSVKVLDGIKAITGREPAFYKTDLCDSIALQQTLEHILSNIGQITAVIHLAGLKAVAESIALPIEYYNNNIVSTLNLLQLMEKFMPNANLIFSSSATVYGSTPLLKGKEGLVETDQIGTGITNPYGRTKFMIELMLQDLAHSVDKMAFLPMAKKANWNIISLRYFNPAGAHASGLIGESPLGIPNNLMPVIIRNARQNQITKIFGNDYDTPDGTAIRDYIHVVDLAEAHIAALKSLYDKQAAGHVSEYKVYNIGTNRGTSVVELINTFEKVNNVTLKRECVDRRQGDLPYTFCNASLALKELGWQASKSIEDICKDSYKAALKS
jgi:UDP-glucose 4-epimerase